MKTLFSLMTTTIVTFFFVSGPLAAEPEKNLEERKSQHLKDIDEKILKMQEHRTCVSSAQSVDDLKKCKESMREFHKTEKAERMENRKKNIEKKLENLKK